MGAEYGFKPVERPPDKPPRPKTRKSALTRQIERAAVEAPDEWVCVATYASRTGAYGAARRVREKVKKRLYPWPVVPVPRANGDKSELYVKVITKRGEG